MRVYEDRAFFDSVLKPVIDQALLPENNRDLVPENLVFDHFSIYENCEDKCPLQYAVIFRIGEEPGPYDQHWQFFDNGEIVWYQVEEQYLGIPQENQRVIKEGKPDFYANLKRAQPFLEAAERALQRY